MAVTANWFADLRDSDDDVFGPRVEDVGKPIDLLGDEPKLNERLLGLLRQEDELAQAGTTCAVRDHADSTCSACPLRRTDPLDAVSALCTVGVTMERTLTAMAILRVPGCRS